MLSEVLFHFSNVIFIYIYIYIYIYIFVYIHICICVYIQTIKSLKKLHIKSQYWSKNLQLDYFPKLFSPIMQHILLMIKLMNKFLSLFHFYFTFADQGDKHVQGSVPYSL